MKKIYQSQWHGIPFDSFATLSSKEIAGADFYKRFYEKFFKKYKDKREINPEWLQLKLKAADFLSRIINCGHEGKILSIGCGLGIIEEAIINKGYNNLEVTEVSEESLLWIRNIVSPEKVHIGFFPECLPEGRLYDFIYLCGVEYLFDQVQLIRFLKEVEVRLYAGGICLLISHTCEPSWGWQWGFSWAKDLLRGTLRLISKKSPGQFWGYARKRGEFHQALENAGFTNIKDGFLGKEAQWDTYWIEGQKIKKAF